MMIDDLGLWLPDWIRDVSPVLPAFLFPGCVCCGQKCGPCKDSPPAWETTISGISVVAGEPYEDCEAADLNRTWSLDTFTDIFFDDPDGGFGGGVTKCAWISACQKSIFCDPDNPKDIRAVLFYHRADEEEDYISPLTLTEKSWVLMLMNLPDGDCNTDFIQAGHHLASWSLAKNDFECLGENVMQDVENNNLNLPEEITLSPVF